MTSGPADESGSDNHADRSGLVIRATRVGDFADLTDLFNLPGYRAGTLRLPHQKPEQVRRWIENQPVESFSIVAVLDGAIVGQAGLDRYVGRRSQAAYLGLGVHDDYVNRGIGTALLKETLDAADHWLDIKRLELGVFTDNAAAIHLYEKFGFEREGLMRSYAFKAGAYADAIGMARLRLG